MEKKIIHNGPRILLFTQEELQDIYDDNYTRLYLGNSREDIIDNLFKVFTKEAIIINQIIPVNKIEFPEHVYSLDYAGLKACSAVMALILLSTKEEELKLKEENFNKVFKLAYHTCYYFLDNRSLAKALTKNIYFPR